MNVSLQEFDLDRSLVPESIYTWMKWEITNIWLSFSPEIREEIDRFIWEFLSRSWFPESKPAFLRIDAYIDPDGSWIQILDVNASFVDGWWNALNLTRAIGASVNGILIEDFPTRLLLREEQYRPEFELAMRELQLARGSPESKRFKEVKAIDSRVPTYIYGNPLWVQEPNTYPYDALRMDNKRLLARFSETWKSDTVQIPKIYTPDSLSWEALPTDWVVKLISKSDIKENPDTRRVQIWFKKNNQALRLLWDAGRLIVQEKTDTMKDNSGNNAQAVILATGKVVAGYVQFSPKGIINDDSIQWPLLLQS